MPLGMWEQPVVALRCFWACGSSSSSIGLFTLRHVEGNLGDMSRATSPAQSGADLFAIETARRLVGRLGVVGGLGGRESVVKYGLGLVWWVAGRVEWVDGWRWGRGGVGGGVGEGVG